MNVRAGRRRAAAIAAYSNGDARSAYNVLEVAAGIAGENAEITDPMVQDALQRRVLLYDKAGEEHYNLISALHKSVRNSDPDAALYWLARMLEAGEDPLYIARRLVRMAVEDIGLADPNALSLCMAARDAVDFIGMPEGNLALAQAAVYLSHRAQIERAVHGVRRGASRRRDTPSPSRCRCTCATRRPLMKDLGYGAGYQYAHDLEEKVADMQCLPDNLRNRTYYHPTVEGVEKRIRERLEEIRRRRAPKANRKGREGRKCERNRIEDGPLRLRSPDHRIARSPDRIHPKRARCSFRMQWSMTTKMPARRAFSAACS